MHLSDTPKPLIFNKLSVKTDFFDNLPFLTARSASSAQENALSADNYTKRGDFGPPRPR
jgi:hypothetical protein